MKREELKKKLERLQEYRDILNVKSKLVIMQKDYNMLPETLQKYIDKIEVKLLTDVSLDRDDRVFCNTLERLLK